MSPAVLVEVRERHPRRRRAGQDLLGLGPHLGQEPVVLGPAVGVRLAEVEIRTVEVARQPCVPLVAHRVRRALDRGRVHLAHPVPQAHQRLGRGTRRRVQILARGVGGRRDEVLEPAPALAVRVRPLGELVDERRGRARARVQLAVESECQGLPVARERGRYRAQPLGDHGPVLVGLRRCQGEDLPHTVHRRVQIADRPQALARFVDGQRGGEPLTQQPGTTALDVTFRARLPLRVVQPREGRPRQPGDGLLADGGGVGEPAVALLHAEVGTENRVKGDELVDVGVGDLAGQRVLRQ